MTDPLLLQTLRDLRAAVDRNTKEQARTNAELAATNAELAAMHARVEVLEKRPVQSPPHSPWLSAAVGALCMALATPVVRGVAGWVLPPTPPAHVAETRRD